MVKKKIDMVSGISTICTGAVLKQGPHQ